MQNSYLNNLKVLDISQGVAGPFCAKLLGDLGADVVKIEPPEGDISRQYGPFPDGTADPEKSASFFFFTTSKRGVVLDLESADGKDALARLVTEYDVVIAGESEEILRGRGQVCHCHVFLSAKLQESLKTRATVLRSHPLIAMRKQHHYAAGHLPLGLCR